MILENPQLVTVRTHWGWSRETNQIPGGIDRPNFTWPDGTKGKINGLVQLLPRGSDIQPYRNEIDNTYDCNSQSVSKYTAPSNIQYEMTLKGTGFGNPWAYPVVSHDGQILNMAGNQIDFTGGAEPLRCFGSFSYCMSAALDVWTTSSGIWYIAYKSPRGGYFEITEFEQGADGIVSLEIINGAPYGVNARRISDNTYQPIAKGGITLPAGKGEIRIRVTWASGVLPAAILAKARLAIEVPYGI